MSRATTNCALARLVLGCARWRTTSQRQKGHYATRGTKRVQKLRPAQENDAKQKDLSALLGAGLLSSGSDLLRASRLAPSPPPCDDDSNDTGAPLSNDADASSAYQCWRDKWNASVDGAATGAMQQQPLLEEANRTIFGNSEFRAHQLKAVTSVLSQHSVFLSLPTGGGKSLCYQLASIAAPGLTLVVQPLLALIRDQCIKLARLGIPAAHFASQSKRAHTTRIYRDIMSGTTKLLFLTPEKVTFNEEFMAAMKVLYDKKRLSLVAVDEAHCISEWGHDFRPQYRRLGILRRSFPQVPFLCTTATATQRTRQDILQNLQLHDARIFQTSYRRSNLTYFVKNKTEDAFQDVLAFIATKERHSNGIIFCLTCKESVDVAQRLQAMHLNAMAYNGDMSSVDRAAVQDAWIEGRVNVLCATVAFGMGIDKADIRYVIHYSMPTSLESYYQQSGRAGRDGKPATCIMYYAPSERLRVEYVTQQTAENEAYFGDDEHPEDFSRSVEVDRQVTKQEMLDDVMNYCKARTTCRTRTLLQHFDEASDDCKTNCDVCITANRRKSH